MRPISRSELRPGDLLFYFKLNTHHVSMYIGNGRAISASSPSTGVEINDPFDSWYGPASQERVEWWDSDSGQTIAGTACA